MQITSLKIFILPEEKFIDEFGWQCTFVPAQNVTRVYVVENGTYAY